MDNEQLLQALSNMMEQKLDDRLAPINNRFDKINSRLDKLASEMSAMRIGQMELKKEINHITKYITGRV